MYEEEDYLQLSGIQHFVFCKRQWGLIHIEMKWIENELTADGRYIHRNIDREPKISNHNNVKQLRSVNIASSQLGLSGIADLIEVANVDDHINVTPIEYKHGVPKKGMCDKAQVCAQSIAIEEMMKCTIEFGAIYYHGLRKRIIFPIDAELRSITTEACNEMHRYYDEKTLSKPFFKQHCFSCSLYDACMPLSAHWKDNKEYIESKMKELQ